MAERCPGHSELEIGNLNLRSSLGQLDFRTARTIWPINGGAAPDVGATASISDCPIFRRFMAAVERKRLPQWRTTRLTNSITNGEYFPGTLFSLYRSHR
jgi:hypothetical protein